MRSKRSAAFSVSLQKKVPKPLPSIYYGLCALQHRGQESCGIAVSDTTGPKGNMSSHKDLGLVNEVLKKKPFIPFMETWVSATSATPPQEEIPPVTPSLWCSITSRVLWLWPTTEIWSTQKNSAGNLKRTAPSSTLPQILRLSPTVWQENGSTVPSVEEAIKKTAAKIRGAYGLVIASPRKLVGVRDPLGLKPLCIGKREDAYVIASESCALSAVEQNLSGTSFPVRS